MKTATSIVLDAEQERAATGPSAEQGLAIVGAPGTGKTEALIAHLGHLLRQSNTDRYLLLTPADPSPLAERLAARCSPDQRERVTLSTGGELVPLLCAALPQERRPPITIITLTEARERLARIAAPLFQLAWHEIIDGSLDPEVSGIGYPRRFLATVLRLIERCLANGLDPRHVREKGLRGTTTFYARPPNFADADLLRATKERYRDTLRIDPQELERQRSREHALTLLLARLIDEVTDESVRTGLYTRHGAVFALTTALANDPTLRDTMRGHFARIFIDEAQDLTIGERRLIEQISGARLPGVVLAGNPEASTHASGAESTGIFALVASVVTLTHRYRGNAILHAAQSSLLIPDRTRTKARPIPTSHNDPIQIARHEQRSESTEAIATWIERKLADGAKPAGCGVALRTLRCADGLIEALLARGIPVDTVGAIDPRREACTGDIRALLWSLVEPRRADTALRLAQSSLLKLSDRTLALLCSAPQQPSLLDAPEESIRSRRPSEVAEYIYQHLFHGAYDHAVSQTTRERLEAFRTTWKSLQSLLNARPLAEALSAIVSMSGIVGGEDARARYRRSMTARYLAFLLQAPGCDAAATLTERLNMVDLILDNDDEYETVAPPLDRDAVLIGGVDDLRGYAFDYLAIADVQAGAFPRYYVPDAFLFSPSQGIIPRDNTPGFPGGRTAKLTWYLHATHIAERAYQHERRRLADAVARAHHGVLITAFGRATLGLSAPELAEELRRSSQGSRPFQIERR